MAYTPTYTPETHSRAGLDASTGNLLLEFGSGTCSICQAAQPLIWQALAAYPEMAHIKIEDGPGRPLGRSYRIKLWPTLVLLKNGLEVARVVRPTSAQAIADMLLPGND